MSVVLLLVLYVDIALRRLASSYILHNLFLKIMTSSSSSVTPDLHITIDCLTHVVPAAKKTYRLLKIKRAITLLHT